MDGSGWLNHAAYFALLLCVVLVQQRALDRADHCFGYLWVGDLYCHLGHIELRRRLLWPVLGVRTGRRDLRAERRQVYPSHVHFSLFTDILLFSWWRLPHVRYIHV